MSLWNENSTRGLKMAPGKCVIGATWDDYIGADNLTDFWTMQSITDEEGKADTPIIREAFSMRKKV